MTKVQVFEPQWHGQLLTHGFKTRQRKRSMSLSEMMTILIAFDRSHYRNFKSYYTHHVGEYWHSEFPHLVSDRRFVEWTPSCLVGITTCSLTRASRYKRISVILNFRALPAPVSFASPTPSILNLVTDRLDKKYNNNYHSHILVIRINQCEPSPNESVL